MSSSPKIAGGDTGATSDIFEKGHVLMPEVAVVSTSEDRDAQALKPFNERHLLEQTARVINLQSQAIRALTQRVSAIEARSAPPADPPANPAPSAALSRAFQSVMDLSHACIFGRKNGRSVLAACNERIVEIPFIHRHLPYPFIGRVLDVGSRESQIAFEVSSLGFESWAIDIREARVQFPGVRFIRGDIRSASFEEVMFDVVIALSTLEHIGLIAYENLDYDEEGDARALQAIWRILKPEGKLLLTIPFGTRGKNNWYRVYDHAALLNLLAGCGFTTESEDYWMERGIHWQPASWQEAERVDSLTQGVKAVVGVVARRSAKPVKNQPETTQDRVRYFESDHPGAQPQQQGIRTLFPASAMTVPPAPRAVPKSAARPGVYFQGIVYGGSGYAEEAWVEALGLAEHRISVQLAPLGIPSDKNKLLPEESRRKLELLERETVDLSRSVFYQASIADLWNMDTYGRWRVARNMFETDSVPDGVRERCNAMDEVWVPSLFNLKTFAESGIDERKLRLVPAGVDTKLFRPGVEPLRIPEKRRFNFLSVFDWHQRKGYDALLLAYLREFKPDEDVALILKVYQINDTLTDLPEKISYFVEREAGVALEKAPPIILVNGFLPQKDMPRLYATADCFVLPTRGEGYGRPFLEALSCQVPVIATAWSGHMDFLNKENSYLLEYRLAAVPADVDLEVFAGHRWAEPDVNHLRQLMRRVFSHPEEARKRAERGRTDIVKGYDWGVIIPRWVAEFRRLLECA